MGELEVQLQLRLQVPDAADTVVCAPDDGWRYNPKHVEQFPEINKLCNVASYWIYIKIFLCWFLHTEVGYLILGAMVKPVPLQAWSGPEGSRRLRFPDFTTTAQEGGKVVSLTHRPHLPPGNSPGTHFC